MAGRPPARALSSVTDKVGLARRLGGILSNTTRTGWPSSRNISIRSPICSTTPPLTASTLARSRVSAPVAGLVRISVIVLPTALSINASGDSKS